MDSPRLAVVVPTLEEAEQLPRLLARLLGVSGGASGAGSSCDPDRADLLIVSDGGSTDGTAEAARRFGATVLVGERGRGLQLAAGAAAALDAGADLLLFLHADCVPDVGGLAAVREAFADTGVVATGLVQRIEAKGALFRGIERAANFRVRRLGLVYGDSALAVRREAYLASGGFRDLPLFEDVDLSRRLRELGRVVLVDGGRVAVSPRRWEREGVLRRTLRNWMLTCAYALGVDPRRLARHYRPQEARP